jgi:metal-dependent amidase/aminoacylase/carboxypeptidase family protein
VPAPGYADLRHDAGLALLWDVNLRARGRQLEAPVASPGGSTDMGNVSQLLPSLHPVVSIRGTTAAPHTAEFAEHTATAAADDALLDGAAAMIGTVVDAASDPEHRAALLRRRAGRQPGETIRGARLP